MITIQLKDEQYNNLMVFLQRVTLSGAEALAFTTLLSILKSAEETSEPIKKA